MAIYIHSKWMELAGWLGYLWGYCYFGFKPKKEKSQECTQIWKRMAALLSWWCPVQSENSGAYGKNPALIICPYWETPSRHSFNQATITQTIQITGRLDKHLSQHVWVHIYMHNLQKRKRWNRWVQLVLGILTQWKEVSGLKLLHECDPGEPPFQIKIYGT